MKKGRRIDGHWSTKPPTSCTSQEQLILEAIDREELLIEYYRMMKCAIGPDGECLARKLLEEHEKHIALLKNLLHDLEELKDLSIPMAD